jgi:hypothetical protein
VRLRGRGQARAVDDRPQRPWHARKAFSAGPGTDEG